LNTTTFSTRCGWAWLSLCLTTLPCCTTLHGREPGPYNEGPAAATPPANPQQEADQLLALARRAMTEGNLEIAGSYLARAESLQPKYPVYHLGETPKKLRDDLQKAQAMAMAKEPARTPSSADAAQLNRTATPGNYPVQQAGGAVPNTGYVMPSYYTGTNDASRVQLAANTTPAPQNGLLLGAPANNASLAMPTAPTMPAAQPTPTAQPTVNLLVRQETLPPGNVAGNVTPPAMPATMPSAAPMPTAAGPMTPYGLPGAMIPAQATEPAPNKALQLLGAGEKALQEGQMDQALKSFREAYTMQGELDSNARARLQDHLRMLAKPAAAAPAPTNLQGAETNQKVLVNQISAEVSRTQTQAREMMARDPRKSLELLKAAKEKYASASVDPATKDLIQRRLDLSINEAQKYLDANKHQIELDEKNNSVRTDVKRDQQHKIEVDEKLAKLITEFNKLQNEQRYGEAEVLAKRANEMAPENPVVVQLQHQAKVARRLNNEKEIRAAKEQGFYDSLVKVDEASIPHSGSDYQFPEVGSWKQLSGSRQERFAQQSSLKRSPKEREIEQRLNTPIMINSENKPLREVIDYLEKVSNINIHLDEAGLAAQGYDSNVPVTLRLKSEIPLKSVFNLILPQYRLAYVIKNDVLNITSEDKTKGLVYTVSYQVADLVIPIPNFVPTGNEGMVDAIQKGYKLAAMGRGIGNNGGFMPTVPAMPIQVAATGNGDSTSAQLHPEALAQQMQNNPGFNRGMNNGPVSGQAQPMQFGPGGMGGGAKADFDSLIQLIQSTVQPTTWKANGGQGDVAPFETNLTLVVSNTQEVHEQLADLLQQLRRLQDLQVTIEVRFITLSDQFFERIGVDFDFSIDDNVTNAQLNSDGGKSAVVGLAASSATSTNGPVLTPTLNIPFTQAGFTEGTVPAFPGIGFNPASAGTFGFAILSDIEAFFLIQAAQGDSRSNILQAPKVTLFNGQSAFISDTSQRPFVTSIIPVVGDFAAAQQPVIVVLSEGTSLTVQAVVSNDRRFVRLTVVPFFSQIGDVEEFTFTGSKTSTSKDTSASNGNDDSKAASKDTTTVTEGTTVQLPTFAFTTVTTTVSVPDGGTVLLGGIKRMSEGRNERGIPILSKLPYINRLFKNVGIGRTTNSLMMMVTPRIIIQEEEEDRLLGSSG
jgi:general secretion pathway protein D